MSNITADDLEDYANNQLAKVFKNVRVTVYDNPRKDVCTMRAHTRSLLIGEESRENLSDNELKAIACHELGHLVSYEEKGSYFSDRHQEELYADRCAVAYFGAKPSLLIGALIKGYAASGLDPLKDYDSHPSLFSRIKNIKNISTNPEHLLYYK